MLGQFLAAPMGVRMQKGLGLFEEGILVCRGGNRGAVWFYGYGNVVLWHFEPFEAQGFWGFEFTWGLLRFTWNSS